MKLEKLIAQINCEKINCCGDEEITDVCLNEKKIKAGCLFFCLKGASFDGHDFAKKAEESGAAAIMCERRLSVNLPQIIVESVRLAMGNVCAEFYGNPQKKMRMIGVVGTNGKTTVSTLISEIMNGYGIPCGLIGTLGAFYGEQKRDTGMTTPDCTELYALLQEMYNCGIKAVCMEYSAHAIYFNKADFIFDALIFTNCTQDHLDFFKTYESYRAVKKSSFDGKKSRIMIINSDDELGKEIIGENPRGLITYGLENPADVFAIDVNSDNGKMQFILNLFDKLYEINSRLLGTFNVYNMLAAAAVCALCGVKTDYIADSLEKLPPVSGRMERVCESVNIFVDYAHTPYGLKNALETLAAIKKDKKLICVFGCGGNRDKSKRKIMGEISGKLADLTVITSDNPRFEEPTDIISQIEEGVRSITREYITVADRYQAIEYAIENADKGDYVLIAGKGAEEYQETMGVLRKFSDKEVACALLEKMNESK